MGYKRLAGVGGQSKRRRKKKRRRERRTNRIRRRRNCSWKGKTKHLLLPERIENDYPNSKGRINIFLYKGPPRNHLMLGGLHGLYRNNSTPRFGA